jgi:hypothetical protein
VLAQGLLLAKPEQLQGIPLAATPFSGEELPSAVDLSTNMPPPGHQGRQNSCTGWALAYALKSYQEKVEEKWWYARGAGEPDPEHLFSPAFIYNQVNNGRDGGAYFMDGLRVLSEQGAATLADMPYRDDDYQSQPDPTARQKAKRFRIDFWRQVNIRDVKEVKAQLNAGYPVVIGAPVDRGFKEARGPFIWRESTGSALGGHAMVVVGYDDGRQAFKVLNSWGQEWGEVGYGWIDYRFFVNTVNEGYVAKDARNAREEPAVPDQTPIPVPSQFTLVQARLTIQNVMHNVPAPWLGGVLGVQITGTLTIPHGMGQTGQVVLHFFFDAGQGLKGQPIRSYDARFADVSGFAATGTARFSLPYQDMVDWQWTAYIPYGALALPSGQYVATPQGWVYQYAQSQLVAEPVLFIDNFGAASGGIIPFGMAR